MTDEQKTIYLAGLYTARDSIIANLGKSGGVITLQIDGQMKTYSGPSEMIKAFQAINNEIRAAESGDDTDFGFALAVCS